MVVYFFLRSSKRNKPVSIWARVRSSKYDYRVPTSLFVKASQWNDKQKALRTGKTPQEEADARRTSAQLEAIKNAIIDYADQCGKANDSPTLEGINKAVSDTITGKNDANREIPTKIGAYLDWLIEQMEAGAFRFGASTYDADTVRSWKVFRTVYREFENYYKAETGRPLAWATIDKATYDAFIEFCQMQGYMTKTINKYVITFKALIRYAAKYHQLHTNTACLEYFARLREVEGCAQTNIYLTEEEIQALYEMELEPGSLYEQVRDVFLIGCYTGQRISDYGKLTADNFKTTARGTRVVKLVQEKTNNSVTIPITNDNLLKIAEKYDYNFPVISDVIINRYIKTICRRLSESVPSLATPVKTALTKAEIQAEKAGKTSFERDSAGDATKPRYDLVKTHTARRSLLTNLYRRKEFSNLQLMSISGHKTERHFYLYLSQSADEIADEIAEIIRKEEEGKGPGKSNEELF